MLCCPAGHTTADLWCNVAHGGKPKRSENSSIETTHVKIQDNDDKAMQDTQARKRNTGNGNDHRKVNYVLSSKNIGNNLLVSSYIF